MTETSESAVYAERASRVILGTVQLGVPYGRRRNVSAPDPTLVNAIFEEAWAHGIRTFDTSEAYGDAARMLSNWLVNCGRLSGTHVVTKVPVGNSHLADQVEKACDRFVGAASIMVLTHGSVPEETFVRFCSICHALGVAAGQSVYTAPEVVRASTSGAVRVQAPVNVLDNRQLLAARKSGIEIDARSVYLQGILLDDPNVAELRVPSIGELVREVQERARNCGMSAAEALLAGVMSLIGPTDRVVLGVDSPDQIKVVSLAFGAPRDSVKRFVDSMLDLRSRVYLKPTLLDPRRWIQ